MKAASHLRLQAWAGMAGIVLSLISSLAGFMIWAAFALTIYYVSRTVHGASAYTARVGFPAGALILFAAAPFVLFHNVQVAAVATDSSDGVAAYLKIYEYAVSPVFLLGENPRRIEKLAQSAASLASTRLIFRIYSSTLVFFAAIFLASVVICQRGLARDIAARRFRNEQAKFDHRRAAGFGALAFTLYLFVFFDVPYGSSDALGHKSYDPFWRDSGRNIYLLLKQMIGPLGFFGSLYLTLYLLAIDVLAPLMSTTTSMTPGASRR